MLTIILPGCSTVPVQQLLCIFRACCHQEIEGLSNSSIADGYGLFFFLLRPMKSAFILKWVLFIGLNNFYLTGCEVKSPRLSIILSKPASTLLYSV